MVIKACGIAQQRETVSRSTLFLCVRVEARSETGQKRGASIFEELFVAFVLDLTLCGELGFLQQSKGSEPNDDAERSEILPSPTSGTPRRVRLRDQKADRALRRCARSRALRTARMSSPRCCICLDEFTSPASLPCSHCFCLECIGEYWRLHEVCQCPLCKAVFPVRPHLEPDLRTPPAPGGGASLKAGEVPCDLCPAKSPAVKSCLVCLASYCADHLEPHYRRAELGRHLLIGVLKNLEDSVCGLHGKRLERFCRSDQTCICVMCVQAEHRGHHVVSIGNEAAKKKVKLKRRKTKVQEAIGERRSRVAALTTSLGLGGATADERARNKAFVEQLEEELADLQRRNADLQQLLQTEDDILFLQRFQHHAS